MLIDDIRPILPGWRFDMLATDIAGEMVERGLPIRLQLKHFTREGERWRLSERIRQMVTFRTHNLLEPCQHLGPSDLILCRNILIYLDHPTRGAVLGATETSRGISDLFEADPDRRGLHRSSNAGARALRGKAVTRPGIVASAPVRTRPAGPEQVQRPPLRLITQKTANG